MRKRFRIVTGVLMAAALCGIFWLVLYKRDRALVYQGKTIEQYLDHLAKAWPASMRGPDVDAVYAMGPEAIPYLRRALNRKKSFGVRSLVFLRAWLPKKLGDRLPVPPTPEYLQRLAAGAAGCLAPFGPLARPAVPDLLDRFDDPRAVNPVYYAVMQIGPQPEDLPQLLLLANGTNRGAALFAADLMGRIGVASPPALTALTNLAEHWEPGLRQRVIRSLGELGTNAAPAIPFLSRKLSDPDSGIRINAAEALWRIEGKTNAPLAFLLKEFEDELSHGTSPSSVQNAYDLHEVNLMEIMGLLKELGAPAQPAVPLLRQIRSTEMILVRFCAAETLWAINRETNGIEPICVEGLAYFDSSVQMSAAELLSRFCVEQHSLSPVLNSMMVSTNSVIQFYAARALWKINGETDRSFPIILKGLQDHTSYDRNPQIRQLAAETLGEMGPKARSATTNLLVALNDSMPEVRAAAADALKKIDPAAAAKSGVR